MLRPRLMRRWLDQFPEASSAFAGVVGGLVMALYEMAAMWALGRSFWSPLEAIGRTLETAPPSRSGRSR